MHPTLTPPGVLLDKRTSKEREWVQYQVDLKNYFALGFVFDQTIACFGIKRSEEGSKNNKMYHRQVQRIANVVKLVEVIAT